MSKELVALEDIILYLNASEPKGLYCENIETIQQALQRLEAIDNVKPSEALEAFGRITLHTEYDNDSHYDSLHFEDDCKLVDKALERLEQIDNANPSEALKCLEDLYCEPVDYRSNDKANDYETIKQALLKVEKEHKALEIIKEKLVDVFKLYNCKTIEEYNQAQYRDCMLTQEEFNLLKEVLE